MNFKAKLRTWGWVEPWNRKQTRKSAASSSRTKPFWHCSSWTSVEDVMKQINTNEHCYQDNSNIINISGGWEQFPVLCNTYSLMGHYNLSLPVDAKIMLSTNCNNINCISIILLTMFVCVNLLHNILRWCSTATISIWFCSVCLSVCLYIHFNSLAVGKYRICYRELSWETSTADNDIVLIKEHTKEYLQSITI